MQVPIDCNGCWAMLADRYDIRLEKAADELHTSRHEFKTPLAISPGGEYIIRIRDDLSGLLQHRFRVHGTIIDLYAKA